MATPGGAPVGSISHIDARASRRERTVLALILAVAAALRLYHVTSPYVDASSWRSIDCDAIARNLLADGFSWWQPRVNWAGPAGIIESELPLMPLLTALVYAVTGVQPWVGRTITLAAGMLGLWYLYALVRRTLGPRPALAAAAVLAINPMHLYFSRMFQVDVPLMTAVTAAIYHLERYLEGQRRHAVFAILAVATGGLLKPTALYCGLPLAALIVAHRGWRGLARPDVLAIAAAGLAPVAAWYTHAHRLFLQYGNSFGVLDGHDKLQTLEQLSSRWWWYVMATEHVWGWVLTPAAIPLFLLGLWALIRRRAPEPGTGAPHAGGSNARYGRALLWAWLAAGCLFVLVVAEGNLCMQYYQLTVAVPAAVVTGVGILELERRFRDAPGRARAAVAVAVAGLVLGSGWTLRHTYDNIRGREIALAAAIDRVLPPSGLFLNPGAFTDHRGGIDTEPMVFYFAQRKGWVLTPDQYTPEAVERFMARGATLLATQYVDRLEAAPALVTWLKQEQEVIEWDRDRVIVRLGSGRRHASATGNSAPRPPHPLPESAFSGTVTPGARSGPASPPVRAVAPAPWPAPSYPQQVP